ncbi:hypothetical protein MH050_03570 [Bacillus licheniformis]|uniref:hypothetical protein n=1 Tax=Bacillus TaxID=1386 RepID=UPI0011A73E96|nr:MULTISPECIES: hypothetical protein [Bacillus]MBU8787778.1 hypothetical protein [Bacillus glycinifermentans]MCM3210428.1 hypothetical protein [Bacillus licheniformis]MCM3286034.1 hypothetical protein [Bacillus licheniformis]MCY7739927.1 hypothetical protein [Bacillus licheniformis]MEC2101916.1 hypothetical protein [Bacillus licheniformis]
MSFKITKGKENKLYYASLISVLALLTLFLSSKSFMFDDEPILQTEYDQPIPGLDHVHLILKKWEYNPAKKIMQVQLKTEEIGGEVFEPKLKFKAKEKGEVDFLKVDVVFHQDENYVVQIKGVPADYREVGLIVSEEAESSPLETESLGTNEGGELSVGKQKQKDEEKKVVLRGDYRKIKKNKNLKKKNQIEYVEDSIKEELQLKHTEIENLEKSIPIQDGIIDQLNDEISKIKANKKYQTETEKAESDTEIQKRKISIEEVKRQKGEMETKLKEAKEKEKILTKKLEEQQREFNKEFNNEK